MLFGVPASELAWLAAILVVGGALTGFLAGLLGVGGGAIAVPVLYHLFEFIGVPDAVRMQLCIGTSLAIIVPTSLRSLMSHNKRGAVDWATLKLWLIPVAVGTGIGALIAAWVSSNSLKAIFGVVAFLIAAQMLVGTRALRISDDLPGRPLMAFYGLLIGVLSSVMGIGGGSFGNLIYAVHGRPVHQGVATAAGLGALIAIPGTLGFIIAGLPDEGLLPPLSLGFVSLIGVVLIAPMSLLAAPLGARLAHGFSRRQLEVALGVFLLVMGGRFLGDYLIHTFA